MHTSENTISDSKEESIAKAIRLLQGGCAEKGRLQRPDISITKVLAKFALYAFVMGFCWLLAYILVQFFHIPAYITHSAATIGCILIIVLKAKAIVQTSVLLYQKYAPEKVRRSCLFTPSCSEYMLLAIEKYGVIPGVCKGIHRICRCHYPNGGKDYP